MQALGEQAGDDDQRHRQGDLRRCQPGAQACCRAGSGRAAPPERAGEIAARRQQRRIEPEEQRHSDREQDGEEQDLGVELEAQDGAGPLRDERGNRAEGPTRGGNTGKAAAGCEQKTLSQHLPHQPAAAGAQR